MEDRLAFHDLLREAAERGLLPNVEAWMEYRRQRNITARTCDEEKAQIEQGWDLGRPSAAPREAVARQTSPR